MIPVEVRDRAWAFGLVWHNGGWAVGRSYSYPNDAVQLRAITNGQLAAPSASLDLAEGSPNTIVPGGPGRAPWLVFSEGTRWKAVHFDGTRRHGVLRIWDKHVASSQRDGWRGGRAVTGVVGWEGVGRARRGANRGRPRTARMRYRGRRGTMVQAARHSGPQPTEIFWVAVGAGATHWVGAQWEDDGSRTSVVLNLFAYPSRLRKTVRIRTPEGVPSGIVGAAPDGHTYVVFDASGLDKDSPALIVSSFDSDGAALDTQRIEVAGWVGQSMAIIDCDGRAWLVFNGYNPATGWETLEAIIDCDGRVWLVFNGYNPATGWETLEVFPLRPRGPQPETTVLWSRQDPWPGSPRSRPARILLRACGPARAAVAIQVQDRVQSGWGDQLIVAQWPTSVEL